MSLLIWFLSGLLAVILFVITDYLTSTKYRVTLRGCFGLSVLFLSGAFGLLCTFLIIIAYICDEWINWDKVLWEKK